MSKPTPIWGDDEPGSSRSVVWDGDNKMVTLGVESGAGAMSIVFTKDELDTIHALIERAELREPLDGAERVLDSYLAQQ